ncbi:hypothetical protein EVG20_g10726 [Dentipellis fragilis]|uniref:Tc1-like transposase DDE domain-containing protein n=1 Tax=Dentipellis fragilis TaxID=205917 RepID=A0A4Y9XRN9_9AGAM|nr:hypothetical protein EVG20_g10726 [Dentipellis fragilis]
MGYRKLSRDIKIAAIRIWEHNLLDLDQILECLDFSERTWYHIVKLWRKTGDVIRPSLSLCGHLRVLDHDNINYILQLVKENPDYFLDKLLYLLATNHIISLKRIAKEHSDEKHAEFVSCITRYEPEELGFLDETSKDERTCGRHYGWSQKGRHAEKKQVFMRGHRTTMTGLLTLNGMEAATVVEGSMTWNLFLEFLEHTVLPKCTAYPGPCSILVMDNAKIHHGNEILELVDRFGVQIEYLLPYSPDLNPIEEAFSKLKHFLRRHQDYYSATQDEEILYNMLELIEIITPEDADGYYIHAGYF